MRCDICGRHYLIGDELHAEGDRMVCAICTQERKEDGQSGAVIRGKFRKVRVAPIRRSGQYRGSGSIEVDEYGLKVSGRHVLSMGARWGIGLAIFVGSLLLTTLLTDGAGYFAPGIIPLYFLMEYGWLRREDANRIRWQDIKRFAADPKRELVAIEHDASTNWESPIVMRTLQWSALAAVLEEKIPDANVLAHPVAVTRGRAIWVSSWIFVGWYLLFTMITGWTLVGIMKLIGVEGIPAIESIAVRVLVFMAWFGIPLVCASLLARRSYRKRAPVLVAATP